MKMEKSHYERPAMKVIALQQRQQLLGASGQGMSGEISGYSKSSGGFSQSSRSVEDPDLP